MNKWRSEWLDWEPAPGSFVGSEGCLSGESPIIQAQEIMERESEGPLKARAIAKTGRNVPTKPTKPIPPMPRGVTLVRWEPKAAPVAIDVCSVVVDVPKFIESELRALDSRLNNPWTIHGGFNIPQMLDRLAQAGVEVEVKAGAH